MELGVIDDVGSKIDRAREGDSSGSIYTLKP